MLLWFRLVPEDGSVPPSRDVHAGTLRFPDLPVPERRRSAAEAVRRAGFCSDDFLKGAFGHVNLETLRGQVVLMEVAAASSIIPELVVEAPVYRVLESSECSVLVDGESPCALRVSPFEFHFEGRRDRVAMRSVRDAMPASWSDRPEATPWRWIVRDAAGVALRNDSDVGVRGSDCLIWESPPEAGDAIRYPVSASVRIPTRWTESVARIVLRDVPIP